MQKGSEHIDDKLLRYLDGTLSSREQEELMTLLRHNPALQDRLNWLRNVDNLLQEPPEDSPSKNFTDVVMANLNQAPARRGISPFKGLLLLMGVILTMGMTILLVYSGAFDDNATINLNNTMYDEFFKQSIPTFSIDGKLMVNIIVILNLIIAFVVLDRTILKPWFQQRTKVNF